LPRTAAPVFTARPRIHHPRPEPQYAPPVPPPPFIAQYCHRIAVGFLFPALARLGCTVCSGLSLLRSVQRSRSLRSELTQGTQAGTNTVRTSSWGRKGARYSSSAGRTTAVGPRGGQVYGAVRHSSQCTGPQTSTRRAGMPLRGGILTPAHPRRHAPVPSYPGRSGCIVWSNSIGIGPAKKPTASGGRKASDSMLEWRALFVAAAAAAVAMGQPVHVDNNTFPGQFVDASGRAVLYHGGACVLPGLQVEPHPPPGPTCCPVVVSVVWVQ
jgi:hypothetical protein